MYTEKLLEQIEDLKKEIEYLKLQKQIFELQKKVNELREQYEPKITYPTYPTYPWYPNPNYPLITKADGTEYTNADFTNGTFFVPKTTI